LVPNHELHVIVENRPTKREFKRWVHRMMKSRKKWLIAAAIVLIVPLCLGVAWWAYDPTVPWQEAERRVQDLLQTCLPAEARIIEKAMHPTDPGKIPFLIRNHPRYRKQHRLFVSGFPESTALTVVKTEKGMMRCYSHHFRGRTAAFTIVSPAGNRGVQAFVQKLRETFAGLPVNVIESESTKRRDPTTN
jgi:hypothetical protein